MMYVLLVEAMMMKMLIKTTMMILFVLVTMMLMCPLVADMNTLRRAYVDDLVVDLDYDAEVLDGARVAVDVDAGGSVDPASFRIPFAFVQIFFFGFLSDT
jgi:hypothetical protein